MRAVAASIERLVSESFRLLKTKTAKNAIIVAGGNLAGQALGFLATLILIRHLGPERFGMVTVAITVMGLASQLSDLGISTGFIRFASQYFKQEPRKAELLMQVTLYLKALIATLVLIIGWFIAHPLAVYVFKQPDLFPLIQLAFVGSLGATLWGYLQAIMQAREWFKKYVWINIFNSILKFVGVWGLVVCGFLTELNALMVIALIPFVAFFLDSILVPKHFLKVSGSFAEKKMLASELFHFSKWITLSTLCTMLTMRLDVLFLQSLTSAKQVGIYGSASQLAMIFPLVTGSLTTVLVPHVVNLQSRDALLEYKLRIYKLVPVAVIGYVVIYFSAPILIALLFGGQYLMAIPVIQILMLGFSISLVINPLSVIFFRLNKPYVLTVLNFLQLVLLVPTCLFLIPRYDAVGAAWSSVVIRVFALCFIFYLLSRISEKDESLH